MSAGKVAATGPLSAKIVVVGEFPGPVEVKRGVPFAGPAGTVLEKALKRVGLDKGSLLMTYAIPYQPLSLERREHSQAAKEEGLRDLQSLLQFAERKVVVALGQQAMEALLGKGYEILEARGYCFRGSTGLNILPSLDPVDIVRQWHPNFRLLCFDLAKAKQIAQRDYSVASGSEVIVMGLQEASYVEEQLSKAELVAVDIETRENLSVSCIAFAAGNVGYCFPWEKQYYPTFRRLLERPGLVFHNGQFDATILRRESFKVPDFDDTMLMWHSLEPTLAGQKEGKKGKLRTEKSLRFLASALTNEPFWKDYEFANKREQMVLCAKDARVTWEIARELERRLKM